jgi:DNA-binding NarL/FixJ family response regulator
VVVESGLLRPAGMDRLPTLKAAAPHAAFIIIGMGDHTALAARARAAGAFDNVRLDEGSERLAQAVRDATPADAAAHHRTGTVS